MWARFTVTLLQSGQLFMFRSFVTFVAFVASLCAVSIYFTSTVNYFTFCIVGLLYYVLYFSWLHDFS